VAPIDGRPPIASTTSTPTKASVRWGFSSSQWRSTSSPIVTASDEEVDGW
jgi:hypothetical protein